MDIFRFVNSNAIREHLKKLGYQFNTLEAAWLVWQCENVELAEKHAAWREIIDIMPDMSIEWEAWPATRASIHWFLEEYIAMEEGWLEQIRHPKAPVIYWDGAYGYYLSLLKDADMEVDSFYMSYIGLRKEISCEIDCGEFSQIRCFTPTEEEVNLLHAFPSLWLGFPTPFKEGDIVCDACDIAGSKTPFVLSERAACAQGSDGSDMVANGWFQDNAGSLFSECMHNYMNLEYYPADKLTGKKRVLKALSTHLNGEIDAALFAQAYHQILTEKRAKDLIPRNIAVERLMLAEMKV